MNGLLQVDKVITELTKCLALNRILHGAGHWKLARCHANLAEAYLDLKSKCQTGSALSFTLNLILTVLNFACLLVLERKAAAVMFSTVPSFPKFIPKWNHWTLFCILLTCYQKVLVQCISNKVVNKKQMYPTTHQMCEINIQRINIPPEFTIQI